MKIGIVAAMPSEARLLLQALGVSEPIVENLREDPLAIYSGVVGSTKVFVVVSSIGKTNAAIATTNLISKVQPDLIINQGVSGSLMPSRGINSLVLATETLYHDQDRSLYEDFTPYKTTFQTAANYTALLRIQCEREAPVNVGAICSGSAFIASKEISEDIVSRTGALAVDMESTSVAQVCDQFNVPLVILRAISDSASDDATELYELNLKLAAKLAQETILNFVKTL